MSATNTTKLSDELGLDSLIGAESLAPEQGWLIKMGFDPTSADLHLGHAVGLFALRALQDKGHRVVMVIGDFTARIGDPSGRNAQRPALSPSAIAENAKTYASQALKILDPNKTAARFNSEWLEPLGAAGMIQLASQSTVAQMSARDDFAKRLDQNTPVGLHEFLYPLLQARDSVELEPDMEAGGSDQLFNLLLGRELMKAAGQKPQACALFHLLPGLDGKQKMSKSLGNHIGLTEGAEVIFSKSMSISDELMWAWMRAMGYQSPQERARLEKAAGEGAAHPMAIKMDFCEWIARRLDGPAAAAAAREAWVGIHQRKEVDASAPEALLQALAEGKGWPVALRELGWCKSASEARDRIASGALKINGEPMRDFKAKALPGFEGLIQFGPKRSAKLRVSLEEPGPLADGPPSGPRRPAGF